MNILGLLTATRISLLIMALHVAWLVTRGALVLSAPRGNPARIYIDSRASTVYPQLLELLHTKRRKALRGSRKWNRPLV